MPILLEESAEPSCPQSLSLEIPLPGVCQTGMCTHICKRTSSAELTVALTLIAPSGQVLRCRTVQSCASEEGANHNHRLRQHQISQAYYWVKKKSCAQKRTLACVSRCIMFKKTHKNVHGLRSQDNGNSWGRISDGGA